jgi:D-3-phosphoglycerate dehydrogenase / 2-oxoglutarate reductase
MKLLNAEPGRFSRESVSLLRSRFDYLELPPGRGLKDHVQDCEIILTKLAFRIDRSIIDAARGLKVIATPTTGLTHIDTEYAESRGICIVSLKGDYTFLKGVTATAELAWGLVLAVARRIPAASRHVAGGAWDRNLFIGAELSGKTLGIVGLGRLGSMVARYAMAFGMHVLATDPAPSCGVPDGVSMTELAGLLAESDVISVHVDLNPRTRAMFGEHEFALMKTSSIFVNTSRGEVVDETALLRALERGHLLGAGLDVLCGELDPEYPIRPDLVEYARTHDTLLITPHLGGATSDSMSKADKRIVELLLEYDTTLSKLQRRAPCPGS